jgi:uncharacterized small protein (DUF1192 family)
VTLLMSGDLSKETEQTRASLNDFVDQLDEALAQLRAEIIRIRAGGLKPKGEKHGAD